jgi:hypothetical protein
MPICLLRVPGKKFGPLRVELRGSWGKLYEKLHNMDRTGGTYGREEKCIQQFGGET